MAKTISWRWNTVAVAGALFAAACSSGNTGTVPNDEGPGGNLGSSSGTSGGDDGASSGTGVGTGTGATGPTGPAAGDDAGDDAASDDADGADDASSASDDGSDDATLAADGSVHDAGIHDAGTHDAGIHDAGTHDAGIHDAGGTPPADASTHDAGTSGGTDAGDALAAARAQCVQIINADRATLSPASAPLTEDTAEEACVDGQAKADFTANTAHSAFGNCNESAQDECPNWPGPPSAIMTKCLAQMWAEGPPAAGQDNHWLNMSNAHYKKVACGFYQTPSGDWWATQDFY
jgi:hypothetical protein